MSASRDTAGLHPAPRRYCPASWALRSTPGQQHVEVLQTRATANTLAVQARQIRDVVAERLGTEPAAEQLLYP